MTTPAAILDLQDISKFITAGNAIFTLVSKKTGDRKTFLVEKAPDRKPEEVKSEWLRADGTAAPGFFVNLLTGPENSSDYRYLGFLFERGGALQIKRNKSGWGEDAVLGFEWLLRKLNTKDVASFEACVEFWHSGVCGRCGHLLTDPESIARGLGPVCAEKSM